MKALVLVFLASAACVRATGTCYWNAESPFQLFAAKTPYETVRGDIRDHAIPQNCKAVSIWTLNRHGNRKPGRKVTKSMKFIASLKEEILASYETGRSQLCAQDIENLKRWTWNDTLEGSYAFLTDTGYKEVFDIGSRLREKYRHLLEGSENEYYFRSANDHQAITSAIAFVHGLTEGTNLTVAPDDVRTRDDVIMPYVNCDRYQKTLMSGELLDDLVDAYYNTADYVAVQNAVQQRLGISTQLTSDSIYAFYELCRFDRSWSKVHQSPWCAAFSDQDLVVLEYRDDIRHYYKNGYASWVNAKLGAPPLNDMYKTFQSFITGQSSKIKSYFGHVTILEMIYTALGIFKDAELQASRRDPDRLWRTSINGAFSTNIIAVLNSCGDSGSRSYRVQIFINEKETELCPLEGCTWQRFQDKFQVFKTADLNFCSMENKIPKH